MINLYDLLEAANGQLFGEPGAHLFSRFCIDARQATESCLYAALKTERGDGHQYMQEAVERGATGLLCSRPPEFDTTGISVILVKNPLQAMMTWSHFVVGKSGLRVIAVTGTAGKSVTLAAIECILRTRYRVLCASGETPGALDIPLTLAHMAPDHQIAALALDIQQPGEMGDMVGAIRPHVGVVTHLGHTVPERFASAEQLAQEVGLLADYLSPGGLIVLNYDDDTAREYGTRTRAQVATVSTEVMFGADVIASNISLDTGRTGFDLRFNDQRLVGRWTPLLGKQQLTCALEALAIGAYFDVPLADALRALTELEPLPGRMKPLEGLRGSLIIDDTYKADPWTTRAALDWLRAVADDQGRTIFVFGDMEPGASSSQRTHRQVGQQASEFVNLLVTQGGQAALAARAALDQGMTPNAVRTSYSVQDAAALVSADLTERDLVLVKGGAASRMDLVVRSLLRNPADSVLLARSSASDPAGISRPSQPTWVEIDLDAVAGNVRQIKSLIGPQVTLFAVVKADAYGHGAISVARTALQNGAEYLAVANIREALELRDAGIAAPILVLSYLPAESAHQAVQYQITATLFDLDLARAYDAVARDLGAALRVHVKVDTGMGRLGIAADKTVQFFRHLARLTHLEVEGLYTHFSTADEEDDAYLQAQTRRFREVVAPLRAAGYGLRYVHAANSAATLRSSDLHFNAVRVGLALYGLSPSPAVPVPEGFRPAMAWKTIVAQVKTLPPGHPVGYGRTYVTTGEERIAILPVGYADGLRRAPAHPGQVLIHGEYAPIVGRVSMEKTAIHVSHIPDVAIGDEVVIMGRQGDRIISAEDIADQTGTISYEVVTNALPRVPRH